MNKIFNLHFTDFCNYACKFCYAKKEKKILSLGQVKIVVDNIADYFSAKSITDGRINIAGGEPTTCAYLQEIIDYINEKKITASIITNGSLLTEAFIKANRNKLSMIGISIDSINEETNLKLGRCQETKIFDYEKLCKICRCIKQNGIILKINIVVSKMNIDEDITKLIDDVKPDRFKILQMLPTTPFAAQNCVTDEEFDAYLEKYRGYDIVHEKRKNIKKAYMIVDSMGYLSTENQHNDFRFNVLSQRIADVIDKIDFDFENEAMRYEKNAKNI